VEPLAHVVGAGAAGLEGAEDVWASLVARQPAGICHRDYQRHLRVVDGAPHRIRDGARHDAGEHRHLLLLDQLAHFREPNVGLRLVVLYDQLDLAAGDAIAALVERELHADELQLAEHRERALERVHHADLDRHLRGGGLSPSGRDPRRAEYQGDRGDGAGRAQDLLLGPSSGRATDRGPRGASRYPAPRGPCGRYAVAGPRAGTAITGQSSSTPRWSASASTAWIVCTSWRAASTLSSTA